MYNEVQPTLDDIFYHFGIMKKNAIHLTLYIALAIVSQACKKDNTSNPETQTLTETLRVNQAFQFDLGSFGDEEGATISKQANHFSISSSDRDINTDKIIYRYTPTTDFVGKDEV